MTNITEQRQRARRGWALLTVGGLVVVLATSGQGHGATRPDIPAAAARTKTHGWPHTPTVAEARQVARFTLRVFLRTTGADSVATSCRARSAKTAAWWGCSVRITFRRNGLTGEPLPVPQTYRVRTIVRVWEDGSAKA